VTLWNVTYHHLARRGVASSPVASSTTWSTRNQHLLVNDRRLNQTGPCMHGMEVSRPCPRTLGRADEGETMVSQIAARLLHTLALIQDRRATQCGMAVWHRGIYSSSSPASNGHHVPCSFFLGKESWNLGTRTADKKKLL
jgi:hypothetical protein